MQLVLQQDDASPDSLDVFEEQFKVITGLNLFEFKGAAHKIFNHSDIHWILNGFDLSITADNPFYELREKQTL